ncbi:MAG: hypothetical protein DLM59_14945, partial [Pseudonocardiales bacterium]
MTALPEPAALPVSRLAAGRPPVQRLPGSAALAVLPVSRLAAGRPPPAGSPADQPFTAVPGFADPGSAALAAGVATRAEDGAVVFREPAGEAAAPAPTPA